MPRDGRVQPQKISVRLHDVATGLAIGIGLLKTRGDDGLMRISDSTRGLSLVEDSLAQLRRLSVSIVGEPTPIRPPLSVAESIAQQAEWLNVELELEVYGDASWLPPNHAELVLLFAREGIRNVSRHAATRACKIAIDLTTCPFEVTVRDWGAGLLMAGKPRSGIGLLMELAAGMGCKLAADSHPGLGTELVLVGPPCAKDRDRESRNQAAASGRQPTENGRQKAARLARGKAD